GPSGLAPGGGRGRAAPRGGGGGTAPPASRGSPLDLDRSASPEDERENREDEEEEEQHLRDARCASGDAAEAEDRRDDRDHEEDSSPVQHQCDPLLELNSRKLGRLVVPGKWCCSARDGLAPPTRRASDRAQRPAAGAAPFGARGCTRSPSESSALGLRTTCSPPWRPERICTRRPSSSPGWTLTRRIRFSASSLATN